MAPRRLCLWLSKGKISAHDDIIKWKQLHQPWLWFITGGYLVKRWFLPAATRARGQSNDLNREILASNLFNCCKEVINAPPVPSILRCIHIVYRHKNVSEYQWSNFIYNCMSTFLHYVHCKDALLDCSAPGGERCESLTRVDEISALLALCAGNSPVFGEFPSQRPVTQSFDAFFDLCPNKRLGKQLWGWWFETPSGSLWRHCKAMRKYGTSLIVWNLLCERSETQLSKYRDIWRDLEWG